jgi:hypothetical protein
VFDQDKDRWFKWSGTDWQALAAAAGPAISHAHFTGTGTRNLQANGRRAVEDLYTRSFVG